MVRLATSMSLVLTWLWWRVEGYLNVSLEGTSRSFAVYSLNNWELFDTRVQGPLTIFLFQPVKEVFDICNRQAFTPQGIKPLLAYYNISAGQRWMPLLGMFTFN